MFYKYLKYFRVAAGLCFLLGLGWFFISAAELAGNLFRFLAGWQFVPALLAALAGGSLLSLLLVLALTLLFGRVYCSFICPLGLFQDAVSRVAAWFKSKKQRRFHYHAGHPFWRLFFFTAAGLTLIFGSAWLLRFTDPYGIFGKMAGSLGAPVARAVTGRLAVWFPDRFPAVVPRSFSAEALAAALFYFVVIAGMSVFRGRLYCNTVCPVGSLLGFISRFSLFRIRIREEKCVHCSFCERVCKAECLNVAKSEIDYSRCVACMNCLTVCKPGALTYTFGRGSRSRKGRGDAGRGDAGRKDAVRGDAGTAQKGRERAVLMSRREAIGTSAALIAGAAAARLMGRESRILSDEYKKLSVPMPPGAVSLDRLKAYCVSCRACMEACPSGIIAPATGEYGPDGFLMPALHYADGFCRFDCKACSDACPTGALVKMTLAQKRQVRMGLAKVTLQHCLIVREGIACDVCTKHCPVEALRLLSKNGCPNPVPVVKGPACLGCGACEYLCPATPKAIRVVPLAKQLTARTTPEANFP